MNATVQKLVTEPLRKYGRHALSAGLLFGLVWDAITINRADQAFENITMLGYLLLTAGVIVGLAMYARKSEEQEYFFPLLVLQFAFGNLASALLVLFFKSGTVAGSFLFLLPLAGLLVANELLHAHYARVHVHVVVWYVFALVYAIVAIPVLTRSFGDVSVVAGVLVALVAVGALLWVVFLVARERIAQEVLRIVRSVGVVTVLFAVLYVARVIPPVPLLATHIGVYHSVERTQAGDYAVSYEQAPWYSAWLYDTSTVFSYASGAPLYCFSSVYAPLGITTPIYHRIETKDADGTWRTVVHVPFDISGGRDLGYRGYSTTSQVQEGQWRCSVETAQGALIARFSFAVVTAAPELGDDVL